MARASPRRVGFFLFMIQLGSFSNRGIDEKKLSLLLVETTVYERAHFAFFIFEMAVTERTREYKHVSTAATHRPPLFLVARGTNSAPPFSPVVKPRKPLALLLVQKGMELGMGRSRWHLDTK